MVRETILASVVAGLVAALVFTLVQSVWVTPLILQGETYEEAADALPQDHESGHDVGDQHHHEADEWKPQDGWQRTLFTFAANLLMGIGYSLVLVALYLLWREPANALGGALYGLAGFAVFFVAPALGLPPELPGTAAAGLGARQQWWVMISAATAVGLISLCSPARWWIRASGVILVVAPHFLIPAPHPAVASSLAPEELQSRFRFATAVCNAIFWLSLGVASGLAFRKLVATGSARSSA